ncbi:MAG: hypothetical protein AAFV88_14835 [Planctomycetota bacterium]
MNNDERIEREYTAAHANALRLIERVRQHIEDKPAPDGETRIGWDDIGKLRHTCARLEDLLEPDEPEDDGS